MKRLTPEQYDMAKTLLNAGLNKTLTAGVVKLSAHTVGTIQKSHDLEHYRQIVSDRLQKYRPAPATSPEPSRPETKDANSLLLNLCEMIKEVREAQDLQTQRMEKLIDMHATIPEAKLARVGLFGKHKIS